MDERAILLFPSLAKAIGLNNAIFLQQLHFWCDIADELGYGKLHDGERWVYKTAEEWQEKDFPFWSVVTVRRIINSLHDQGLIYAMYLNDDKWDRTLFYRINYLHKILACDQIDNMHVIKKIKSKSSKRSNASDQNDEMSSENTSENTSESTNLRAEQFEIFWKAYPNKKDRKRAEQKFHKVDFKKNTFEKIISSLEKQKQSYNWQKESGRYVPMASTWINGERWNDEIRADSLINDRNVNQQWQPLPDEAYQPVTDQLDYRNFD